MRKFDFVLTGFMPLLMHADDIDGADDWRHGGRIQETRTSARLVMTVHQHGHGRPTSTTITAVWSCLAKTSWQHCGRQVPS